MANITFSHPDYKDLTVYAVAGSHTETVLKIAREHKLPIQFDCQNGECGTCLVRVTYLDKGTPKGGPLTAKEQVVLRELGKLSADDVERMSVDDIPPPWRLACQMIIRDEDILVEYGIGN